jgi:hypothetical protein
MTTSYLKKALEQTQTQNEYSRLLKGTQFYIWDPVEHARQYDETKALYGEPRCCFNHIIHLPRKDGVPKGLFDYEQQTFNAYQQYRHVWIKKSRGLGVTELTLRYLVWKCFESSAWKNKQACVVTGPRINLAVTLIDRIRKLLPKTIFDTRETMVELNSCKIEAYPSHNIDAMRGLTDVKFILVDEADMFPPSQQQEVRAVVEGYIQKSNPHIILVSTPGQPEGLFQQIEMEENSIYHKLFLPYTVGIGKIYSEQEIQIAQQSPLFEKEMNLAYIGQAGNIFDDTSIQRAIDNEMLLRAQWHPDLRDMDAFTPSYDKCMGIDAGFGSSRFGICVTQFVPAHEAGDAKKPLLQVVFAEEYERPSFDEMINRIINMKREWNIKTIMVDSANPEVITAIKNGIGERSDFETQISKLKASFRHVREDPVKHLQRWMSVIPVSFSTEGRSMLGRAKIMLDREWLAIHPAHFHKLIIALRTAQSTDGLLDKTQTSHDDILDAFRLSLLRWSVD